MGSLESFQIDLKGLKQETKVLEYNLDDSFFGALDVSEVKGGSLHASVTIRKSAGFFELLFNIDGTVRIPCDLCLDDMEQPIETENRLLAKLGEMNSEDDDTVMVSEDEGILDLSWFIYEFVALAIPIKHVHAPGKCNPAMIHVLEEHSTDRSSDEESTKPLDPRWAALMELDLDD
ncbi:MAG: DUF177 domain-containing protein [Prevotella sp.]|nr:DUF177 domain-containing protein [Prevotella sp.]